MIRAKTRVIYAHDEIQWKCLDALWTMESHWNFRAKGGTTPQGRALGIPQALPAIKMKSMGADFQSNPMTQVKWGLKYLKTRYSGKACYALRHELLKGWY
jgi:resuscitation-promoting factor RpfB